MSYRTYINDVQVFGNNEYYELWGDFLESQGIEIDEDGCYDGYITDLQGMFNVIDKITRKIIDDRHNEIVAGEKNWNGEPFKEMTDFTDSMWLDDKTPLLRFNMLVIHNAYCFLPYQVFKAVEDIIEPADETYIDSKEWFCCSYKLKDGEKIYVSAG